VLENLVESQPPTHRLCRKSHCWRYETSDGLAQWRERSHGLSSAANNQPGAAPARGPSAPRIALMADRPARRLGAREGLRAASGLAPTGSRRNC